MKAADLSSHPQFNLMKQSDIVSFYHLQMPRWLYVHSRYKTISLEAKVAYTFLLNRFQLSKLNNWVNADNEVFVIFTRESLAEEMGISYRKAIACFKELVTANLIWEQRLGRGHANQIYLAAVNLSEEDASKDEAAPFTRPAKNVHQESEGECGDNASEGVFLPKQDLPDLQAKTCKNGTSRSAETAYPDMPNPHTSNTKLSYIDFSNTDISQSGRGQSDGIDLSKIIENCELAVLPNDIAGVFKNAIERLYYAKEFRIDGGILPQKKIRSDLVRLDSGMVLEAYRKLKNNTRKVVKNSTAYLMAVIYNCIFEVESDLLVDPDLNRMGKLMGGDIGCY